MMYDMCIIHTYLCTVHTVVEHLRVFSTYIHVLILVIPLCVKVPVHNACRSSLSSFRDMMESSHNAVAAVPGMSIPRQFDGKVVTCQDRFSDLNETSDQWKARVLALVASWEEFRGFLDELNEWVWSREAELDSLQVLEEFAGEFSSHQTRLNVRGNNWLKCTYIHRIERI